MISINNRENIIHWCLFTSSTGDFFGVIFVTAAISFDAGIAYGISFSISDRSFLTVNRVIFERFSDFQKVLAIDKSQAL